MNSNVLIVTYLIWQLLIDNKKRMAGNKQLLTLVSAAGDRLLENKLEEERLIAIVEEAVAIEKEFVCDALPVNLIGMNKELMSDYINFVADRLLVALGSDKHFNTPNPFDWMELLSLQCVIYPGPARLAPCTESLSCCICCSFYLFCLYCNCYFTRTEPLLFVHALRSCHSSLACL